MKKQLLFLLLIMQSFIGFAQNPAEIDIKFPGQISGFNGMGMVFTMTTQPDGKILVGGDFTSFNGLSQNRLIRLNADGTKDINFNIGTGFNSLIRFIALQPDGKILVGGDFTTFNGLSQNQLIRLNTDGTQDTSFNIGTGFNQYVSSLIIQPDGKILVGGNFTTFNGLSQNRLIRLNADGTEDTNFNIGIGFNDVVFSTTIEIDGKILVGGQFTTFNGVSENRLIRLNSDGTKDTNFNIGIGFNDAVFSTTIQIDGKILAGGRFTTFNGDTQNFLVRLNINGSKDTSFNIGNGFNNVVYSIVVQQDDKILAGGQFTSYNWQTNNRILRLNANGTQDSDFNPVAGFNGIVRSIATLQNGKILAGGLFSGFNGMDAENIVCLNTDGTKSSDFSINNGFNSTVYRMAIQQDNKVLVGGSFTNFNGLSQNRIIRINPDGSKDISFNVETGFDNLVRAIAIQPDGKILVGGEFTSYQIYPVRNRLIRLNIDGTLDSYFNIGTGFDNNVLAIAIQPDGKILVGGDFTSFNGLSQNSLVRLNSDGTLDVGFNVGTELFGVNEIKIQTDGKILIGSNRAFFNGIEYHALIRLNTDGTEDSSFNLATEGIDGSVVAIAIQQDNKVLVGGSFTTFNGLSQNGLVRLNSDGALDTNFNIGIGFEDFISSIDIQPDGKILVGGDFTTFNGLSQNSLIRLNTDGTQDTTFNIGMGFNNSVYSIKTQLDGKIWLSGNFTSYNGINSANLIRLYGGTTLSTTDFSKNKITLYPNPTKDILNFTLSESISATAYEIYNLLGEKVSYGDLNSNSISVSNLANGVYIVKINTSEGVLTEKFIKE